MFKTGMVSVTFRKLQPEEVVRLTAEAGLSAIEWGGDVHAPAGDEDTADRVIKLTKDAGLKVSAYGSYFRAGTYEEPETEIDKIINSAVILECPLIRIWAGQLASSEADETYRLKVMEQGRLLAGKAQARGMRTAWEHHRNTLTDTVESVRRLITEAPIIGCYWQPDTDLSPAERIFSIKNILPALANVHVFHWKNHERLPLQDGIPEWQEYFVELGKASGDRYVSLEFVRADDIQQFKQDAAVLKKLTGT
jgi:sugar phosphate isomerase/epimerase